MKIRVFHHWLYPLLVSLLFFAILAGLLTYVQNESYAEREIQLNYDALVMRESLATRIQAMQNYLTMVAEELVDDPQARQRFSKRNRHFLESHREILGLYFLNDTMRPLIRDTVYQKGLPPDRNLDLPESRESFARMKLNQIFLVSKMFPLISGEKVFLIHTPLVRGGRVRGSLTAIISVASLLEQGLNASFFDRYQISFINGEVSFSHLDEENVDEIPVDSGLIQNMPLPEPLNHFSVRLQSHPLKSHWQMQLLIALSIGLAILMAWAIWGLSRDNQRRQKIQEELHKAMQAAKDANRAKSELLANISHEIRTPLGIIKGFCGIARNQNENQLDWQTILTRIERNADSLLNLVNDILDLSKVEAGLLDIRKSWFRLHDLMADVTESLAHRAEEKKLDFSITWADDLDSFFYTDPMRLRQILFNVINNAIKFTEYGGIRIKIDASPAQDSDPASDTMIHPTVLKFEIQDTGIGLDEIGKQRLFQSFSQADSSIGRRYGGTGLGLALSRRLARQLGGELLLKASRVGEGSCFEIAIFLDSRQDVRGTQTDPVRGLYENTDTHPRSEKPLLGIQVLIVEDSVDNQIIYQNFLEDAGAQIILANNGVEALDSVAHTQPDMILMDIQMPIMDGYEATRKIRALGIHVPIVALSAHAMKGEREKAYRAGCLEYLTKPVDQDILVETIFHFVLKRSTDGNALPAYVKQKAAEIDPARQAEREQNSSGLLLSSMRHDPRVAPLLQTFLENSRQKLERIRSYQTGSDYAEIARIAHQMKGSSGHYGYQSFVQVAAVLEEACLNPCLDLNYISQHISDLSLLVEQAGQAYEQSKLT